jgi:hypothetical protein
MGVYSPNALGWFWLAVLIPATVVTLIWACVLDVKEKNKKALTTKVLIFLTVVLVSVGYWFYQAGQVESMG